MKKIEANYELSWELTHLVRRHNELTWEELMSVALCDPSGLYYDREYAIDYARSLLATKLIELYQEGKIQL